LTVLSREKYEIFYFLISLLYISEEGQDSLRAYFGKKLKILTKSEEVSIHFMRVYQIHPFTRMLYNPLTSDIY